jgi:hypothetical protein
MARLYTVTYVRTWWRGEYFDRRRIKLEVMETCVKSNFQHCNGQAKEDVMDSVCNTNGYKRNACRVLVRRPKRKLRCVTPSVYKEPILLHIFLYVAQVVW